MEERETELRYIYFLEGILGRLQMDLYLGHFFFPPNTSVFLNPFLSPKSRVTARYGASLGLFTRLHVFLNLYHVELKFPMLCSWF